jgi:energy-dependent translational throttle protein EttA
MAPQFIYVMKALKKVIPPSRIILDDIWLSFYPGAKIGVLGPNGAGKSSLLRIMAGVDTDFRARRGPHKGTRIGYLSQEPELDPTLDVRGNVELAVKAAARCAQRASMRSPEVRRADDADFDAEADGRAGEAAGIHRPARPLESRQQDRRRDGRAAPPAGDSPVTNLSGGEKRRVALCKVLLEEPDMLLLDEPTNHLDAESVAWLEHFLESFPGTVVAITHDRYFLDNVAKWILELDRGKGVPYEGNYSGWLEQKQERWRSEEKQASARQKTLQKELEWVRMAPQGAAGQEQGASAGVRGARERSAERPRDAERDRHPAGAATRQRRGARQEAARRRSATSCCSRISTSRCRARASSASSARTAPARRRCSA